MEKSIYRVAMAMLYHCGALKPEAERYLDRQFRLFARRFSSRRVDYDDALCLAAFLAIVPIKHARWIFQWDKYGIRAAKSMRRWFTEPARAEGLIDANLKSIDADDGLAVVQAMRAGGWERGRVPEISRRDIKGVSQNGLPAGKIAKATGVHLWLVLGVDHDRPDLRDARARAVASIAM